MRRGMRPNSVTVGVSLCTFTWMAANRDFRTQCTHSLPSGEPFSVWSQAGLSCGPTRSLCPDSAAFPLLVDLASSSTKGKPSKLTAGRALRTKHLQVASDPYTPLRRASAGSRFFRTHERGPSISEVDNGRFDWIA
jgi:hypothetical protein